MELQQLYDKAYIWIITLVPRFFIALFILIIGLWIIRRLCGVTDNILQRRRIDESLRPFLVSALSLVLQILLVLSIMQILGIQLTIFAALIGAFGVAAGLALSGTLQNFTSGILILLMKPFRVGDNIIAQGQEGIVHMIRIFYTVVTTFDNRTVIIPNSKLSNEVIINLSRQGKRRLDIEMKFSFAIPYEKVKQTIEKTIQGSDILLKEPAYRIGISSLDPDGYKVMVNVWSKAHGFQDMKMIFQRELLDDLLTTGIKLPGTG
jgi:small conductance mechanosensitive channel